MGFAQFSKHIATSFKNSDFQGTKANREVVWGKKKGIRPQDRGIRHRCLNGTNKLHAFVQGSIIIYDRII